MEVLKERVFEMAIGIKEFFVGIDVGEETGGEVDHAVNIGARNGFGLAVGQVYRPERKITAAVGSGGGGQIVLLAILASLGVSGGSAGEKVAAADGVIKIDAVVDHRQEK